MSAARSLAAVVLALGPLLGAVASGCATGDTTLSPVLAPAPRSDAGVPADSGAPDSGAGGSAPAPDAGPVKRTVLQRNPFGDVAATENLLWDGDFEWASPISDEYGWMTFLPAAWLTESSIRIGAVCHSGVKCALVPAATGLLGIGVGSKGNPLEASFWAHPAGPTCARIAGTVTDGGDGTTDPDVPIAAVSETPDAGGWCQFDSVVAVRQFKTYVSISNDTGADLIVDDVVLVVAPAGKERTASPAGPPTPEEAAKAAAIHEGLAALRGPHDRQSPFRRAIREQFQR
jgi:hypothetical protein